MNLHLFLDVVSWAGAVFFSAAFMVATTEKGTGKRTTPFWRWIFLFVAATLCWAWIIAG